MAASKKVYNQTKIPARYKEGESELAKHWQTYFLDHLAETSNVSAAARFAGANPSRAYKLRRENPEFARKWRAALLEGYEHLEMETLQRLRDGVETDGPKFDMSNALRLLTLHRASIIEARAEQRNVSAAEVRASIDKKVEQIRLQALSDKASRAVD